MKRKGFTLVELIMVTAIFGVVSIAIYATFASGLNIWRRVNDTSMAQKKDLMKIEKLSRELRQVFVFKDIGLKGNTSVIHLPAIIDYEIVRVTYSFDSGKNAILRGIDKLPDILVGKTGGGTAATKLEPYLSGIDSVKFSYFYYDLLQQAYLWKEEWKEPVLPLAVKLDITANKQSHAAIIFIPVSS